MLYSSIIFTKKGHIAYLTVSRPEANNVINQELAQEISDVCRQISHDSKIYVVVITGAGSVFCAGSELSPAESGFSPAAAIASIGCPVIAAINGDAIGEGLEIALSCDIRIASDKARFGLPQVSKGNIPTDGGTQRLARVVGKAKALEMLFTAETIGAAEALAIGMVSKVVPDERLAVEADELAKTMASKGPVALRYVKEAVNKGMDMTLEQGLHLEADLYLLLHTTADRTEGIRAFLEKRTPKFKGK